MRRHITRNVSETHKLATAFFAAFREKKFPHALVLALVGNLGAGKTTFVQGLLRALGIRRNILSPTFVIMKRFSLRSRTTHFRNAYHIDAYRIGAADLKALGIQSIFKNPDNLIIIEWAERVRKILPPETIWLEFEHGKSEGERVIIER